MVALGAVSIDHLKKKWYPHHTWFNIFLFIYNFNTGVYFLRNEIVVNAKLIVLIFYIKICC